MSSRTAARGARGAGRAPAMGRPKPLDADAVVAAAARLADAEGLDALTLSRVAAELGVRPPSLYNHVDSLAGLLRGLSLAAVGELGAAITAAAVGLSREYALRSVAVAFRSYAKEHPGRYAATVRAPARGDTEAEAAAAGAVGPMVAVIGGWGIEGEDAVHLVRVVRSALHGFVSIELGGGFGLPLDLDRSFDLLADSLVVAIESQAEKAS
jgi:AcrR family transcriptional regulator